MKQLKSRKSRKAAAPISVGEYLAVVHSPGESKVIFKGTRVPAQTVLTWLAKGKTLKDILTRWPSLKRKAIAEAIDLAAAALVERSGARPWRTEEPEDVDAFQEQLERLHRSLRRQKPRPIGKYLIVHPRVCFGRLTFDGTRLPVEVMLTYLGMGKTFDYILKGWPYLKRQALVEAIELATAALVERYATRAEEEHEPAHPGRRA